MSKLKIRYDLINKVKEANGQFALSEDNNRITKAFLLSFPIHVAFAQMIGLSTTEALLSMTIIDDVLYLWRVNMYKDFNRQKAIQDLKELSELLKQMDLNTSGELLLGTVQCQQTSYRLKFDARRRPHLIQVKEILIPTDDDVREEVLILQEHEMHLKSKPYFLTKGSLSYNFKPAFNLT